MERTRAPHQLPRPRSTDTRGKHRRTRTAREERNAGGARTAAGASPSWRIMTNSLRLCEPATIPLFAAISAPSPLHTSRTDTGSDDGERSARAGRLDPRSGGGGHHHAQILYTSAGSSCGCRCRSVLASASSPTPPPSRLLHTPLEFV